MAILDQYGSTISSEWAFDSAKRTSYRGYFYFPSLDPQIQMPQWTREQTARKTNWCYNNIGAVKAVIDGLAVDEVDTGLWPKPATISDNFNRAVRHAWHQQCEFHKAFSADGENNFYSAQLLLRRELRLRGDAFGQKLRAGEAASCPQMHFLPSYQCADYGLTSTAPAAPGQWRDGRRDNKFGRAMEWRFATSSRFDQWMTVDQNDVTHFHDPMLIGQKRQMPALAAVVRKLFTADDIERTESSGVTLRSRMAYAIERGENDDDGPTILPGARVVETVKNPDGSTLYVQKLTSRDGLDVDVADLTKGKKISVLESSKSSEAAAWIKTLLTDVAYCTLYPPDYIFALAGLSQGTMVRMTQQKVQRVVNSVRDFQLIMQMIEEWYPFWLWQNISSGTFDNVKGGIPDEWWPYIVVRPKDLTVDMGREGRLYDDRLATGKMPSGLYVGMLYGEDEEEFEDRIIRDAYRRRASNTRIALELNVPELPIETIFRPPPGTAAAPAVQDPDQDAADKDAGEDPDKSDESAKSPTKMIRPAKSNSA